MKKNLLIAVLSLLMGGALVYWTRDMRQGRDCPFSLGSPASRDVNSITVYFSPNGGCTEAICTEIRNAKIAILVQAYSFTSKEIVADLVAARARGTRVAVIIDRAASSDKYCLANDLLAGGCEVFIDGRHAIAHNKVMVIDSTVVLTGSFNFTAAAEKRNAENVLVIRNAGLAASYEANWARHQEHSPALEKP